MQPLEVAAPPLAEFGPCLAVGREAVHVAGEVDDRVDAGIGERREFELVAVAMRAAWILPGEDSTPLHPPRVEPFIERPRSRFARGHFRRRRHVQPLGERLNAVSHGEQIEPEFRNAGRPEPGPSQLPCDRGRRVGVVTEVRRAENRRLKILCTRHRPDRRFEGRNAVARALDRRRRLVTPAPAGHGLDLRMERALRPEIRARHRVPRLAANERGRHCREHLAGVHRPGGGMRGPARRGGELHRLVGRVRPPDRDGRETHQRTVGGRLLVYVRVVRLARALEPSQLLASGDADIETSAGG